MFNMSILDDGPDGEAVGFGSAAGVLCSQRFAQAADYANQAWDNAWTLLDTLKNIQYDLTWTKPEIPDITTTVDPNPAPATLGNIADVTVATPSFSEALPTMPETTINSETAPEFGVVTPEFNIPDAPTVEWPIFSTDEPDLTDPDIPTKPAFTLPDVPDLASISIPSPPEYNLPDFEGTVPTTDLTPPEPSFAYAESMYTSDLKDLVDTKLETDIVNGGSGLDADTEAAIYSRATARNDVANQEMYDEALYYFSARGFLLPPGALAGRLMEIGNKITQSETDIANDILVQQSKLAQDNTHFTVTSAIQHEQNLMSYTNQFQQRAFEAAKFVVEAALTVFQAKTEAYKAEMMAYQALATVYEARIRAEIGRAELYKAQIQGIEAGVQAQAVHIQAYTAQINGVNALIEAYKAEMQGAQIQSAIDGQRVENFGNLVKVHQSRIDAIVARYRAYEAQISGEAEKARMFAAMVSAYESQVNAYKARMDVDVSRVQADATIHTARVNGYQAAVDKYKADAGVLVAQSEAEVKSNEIVIRQYEAEITKYDAELEAAIKVYLGKIEEQKAKVELEIAAAEGNVRLALGKYELTTKSAEASARIASQLSAAAMSSISASAAIGYREARSESYTRSRNTSNNDNVSSWAGGRKVTESHNHNYQE